MNAEEAAALEPGLYRITWTDAHAPSIGIVIGPQDITIRNARPLATIDGRVLPSSTSSWRLVESVERLEPCFTHWKCATRQALHTNATPIRLALASNMGETVAEVVRDGLLVGDDAIALSVLAHELGLVPLASPRPVWRPLSVGDPVVVVAYGRIIDSSNGCFAVSLFSEGLGYVLARTLWVEPDELRYSVPPEHVQSRIGKGHLDLDGTHGMHARDRPTGVLGGSWRSLSNQERLALMSDCCSGCGALDHDCDCQKRATEGTF